MRPNMLDGIAKINRAKKIDSGDLEIDARIAQYEMAYRMQTSVPELTDVAKEPKSVLDLYGPSVKERGSFAYNCLMARRLIERGTRFVQVMHAGWDQHRSVTTELYNQCRDTDQPSAGLIADLKQRGLLEDTLVVWGGEFGRTPVINSKAGRDHWPRVSCAALACGGMTHGQVIGATDKKAGEAVDRPVKFSDVFATLYTAMGINIQTATVPDLSGRPRYLVDHGSKALPELIS